MSPNILHRGLASFLCFLCLAVGWTSLSSQQENTASSQAFQDWPKFPWLQEQKFHLSPATSHTDQIRHATLAADDNTLITNSLDGTIYVWDLALGIARYSIPAKGCQVAISDGGSLGAIGDKEQIRLWNIATGTPIAVFAIAREEYSSILLTTKLLLGENKQREICVWDIAEGKRLYKLPAAPTMIRAIALNPRGNFVVASCEETAWVWDLQTGRQLFSLTGHTRTIRTIVISADGKSIVTGSEDATARVWDAATGGCINVLDKPDSAFVKGLAISPDGSFVIGCSTVFSGFPLHVWVWDMHSGEVRHALKHSWYVFSLSISQDNSRIITGIGGKKALVWDAASGKLLHTLSVEDSLPYYTVFAAFITRDGKKVISAGEDAKIRIWEASTGKLLRTLYHYTSPVRAIEIDPAGEYLVAGSSDLSPWIWDLQEGKHRALKLAGSKGWGFSIGQDNTSILIRDDRQAWLWDLTKNRYSRQFIGPQGSIFRFTKIGNKEMIAWQQGFHQWRRSLPRKSTRWETNGFDLENITQQKIYERSRNDSHLVYMPWDYIPQSKHTTTGSHYIVTTLANKDKTYFWNATQNERHLLWQKSSFDLQTENFSLSPFGEAIATFSEQQLQIWHTKTETMLWQLSLPSPIATIAFHPRGDQLVVACSKGSVQICELATKSFLTKMQSPSKTAIQRIAFAGDYMILATERGTVEVWSLLQQELVHNIAHPKPINDLAIFKSFVFTACADGAVRIWDYRRGIELARLYRFVDDTWAVVTPDGRWQTDGENHTGIVVWERGKAKRLANFPAKQVKNLLHQLLSKSG